MMKRKLALALVVLACISLWFSACGSSSKTIEDVSGVVVSSYLRTWPLAPEDQKGSLYWDASMVDAQYLTDLNIAFALIDGDDGHTIYIPELRPLEDGNPMFSAIWQEVAALKNKYPNLKVNISVGGWGADYFSDMANKSGLRKKFVDGVCEWLESYNLDGIDIDWEYPVGPEWGQEIKSRPADARNYIALLRDLRKGMDKLSKTTGKRYSLSTAVPASDWFPEVINVKAAAKIVDALKMMSYDYYGAWSENTGHLANIFNNPDDPEWGGWSTDQAVDAYLEAGVPPQKIQMGMPFYGRAFQGVTPGPKNDGLFQPYETIPFPENEGFVTWPQIQEYLKPGSGFTRYWDEVARSPYLYNGDLWITYCDEQLIRELVAYSKSKKLGGFFSWEYGTDMNASLLKTLSDNAR